MQAVLCTRYGPPDVLQLAQVPQPTPAPNELLIKVHATSVTAADRRIRGFDVPPAFWLMGRLALGLRRPRQPILGSEYAGEVAAVGADVRRFKVGERVYGLTGHHVGSYAEYTCVAEDSAVALMPPSLSMTEAAAIPFGAITALRFLQMASLQAGQRILINGGSSAVGVYAIQLAHYMDAEVTAVCSGANLELVTALGAKHAIDYTRADFRRNGQRYDVIFDAVGTTTFAQVKDSLTERGVLLHAVLVGAGLKGWWYKLRTGKTVVGGNCADLTDTPIADDLAFLAEMVEAGHLKPVIDHCLPLEQIVAAHRYADTGRKKGALVITIVPQGVSA